MLALLDARSQAVVESAVVVFDGADITPEQMARHVGFDEEAMRHLTLFRPAVFNKSWLFLDRDVIREWFCGNDTSRNAIGNFVSRILAKYTKDVDYKEVSSDSPEAASYLSSDLMTNQGRGRKIETHYLVTGECFKMIGMERNRTIREHFVRIEQLFWMMCQYKSDARARSLAQQAETMRITMKTEVEETAKAKQHANEQAAAEKRRADELAAAAQKKDEELAACHSQLAQIGKAQAAYAEASINVEPVPKVNYMYIATSAAYMLKKLFKVGGVDSRDHLIPRLNNYNGSHATDDPFFFVYVAPCESYKLIETGFWLVMDRFRDKQESRKEMVHADYNFIESVLNGLIRTTGAFFDGFTAERFIDAQRMAIERPACVLAKVEIEPKVAKTGARKCTKTSPASQSKVDVSSWTDAMLRAALVAELDEQIRKSNAEYSFEMQKASLAVDVLWSAFVVALEAKYVGKGRREWCALMRAALEGSKVRIKKKDS